MARWLASVLSALLAWFLLASVLGFSGAVGAVELTILLAPSIAVGWLVWSRFQPRAKA
ncbi:MAG: hypothetical protein GXP35_06240 [Actinobacteria bacterium]|nr:hypothetical protein [Actinomycetota bacterium]